MYARVRVYYVPISMHVRLASAIFTVVINFRIARTNTVSSPHSVKGGVHDRKDSTTPFSFTLSRVSFRRLSVRRRRRRRRRRQRQQRRRQRTRDAELTLFRSIELPFSFLSTSIARYPRASLLTRATLRNPSSVSE